MRLAYFSELRISGKPPGPLPITTTFAFGEAARSLVASTPRHLSMFGLSDLSMIWL
jgi:hypothetical protein